MSANSHHSAVEVLRSPEEQTKELRVVDFEEATATLAGVYSVHQQKSFCFPPSPPYTNPHLKRAIPLPLLDEKSCRLHSSDSTSSHESGSMSDSKGIEQFRGGNGAESLLSPPYSPQRRLRMLLSVDEDEEEAPSYDAPSDSSDDMEDGWRELDDSGFQDPPSLLLKDLDLGDESDDWDEPLFLNAPSALASSADGLDLNLFGGSHPNDVGPSHLRLDTLSSPSKHFSSLPDLEDESREKSKPLFDPSDFDVFENGWDTLFDTTQTIPLPIQKMASEEMFGCIQFPQMISFAPPKLAEIPLPKSPSRRCVIDLPGDETSRSSDLESLDSLAPVVARDVEGTQYGHAFALSPRSSRTLASPPSHQPFDIPSDIFQSPFNISLFLSSPVTRSPTQSLLFAPAEPQDIPLPESPENQDVDIPDINFNVPLHMFEESRLRAIQQEMFVTEMQAKNREAMLTDYIARLNAMKQPPPLPLPTPIPMHYSRPQPIIGLPVSTTTESQNHVQQKGLSMSPEVSYIEAHRPTVQLPSASNPPNSGLSMVDFSQARRREVQNAVTLRAAERRRRKRAKERAREIEALLQLKAGRLRAADAWELAGPQTRRRQDDEVVVLVASGSDRHGAHNGVMLFDAVDDPKRVKTERHEEVKHLVAKMIFRRRDSPRSLSGKSASLIRPYVRSSLSRAVQLNINDDNVEETPSIKETDTS